MREEEVLQETGGSAGSAGAGDEQGKDGRKEGIKKEGVIGC